MISTAADLRLRAVRLRHHHDLAAAALCLVLALVSGCASGPPPATTVQLDFPSPLSGPGRPAVDRTSVRRLDGAWQQLSVGRLVAARNEAEGSREGPHRELLLLQLDLLEDRDGTLEALAALANRHPSWAAAWITLSVAAERSGDEAAALAAARRSAELWQRDPWQQRPAELHRLWVSERLAEAGGLLEGDDPAAAMELLEAALALDPGAAGGAMLEARVLIASGRVDEAEEILATLADEPEAVMLRGLMAETRADWLSAMELYASLPEDHSGRDEALLRAQLQWRLTVLPAYVHRALDANPVSRGDLAVILLALAPDVEALATSAPPLLSDIVELDYQREILTSVRVDLISVDPLEHRFYPDRPATVEEVADAIEALSHLLGFQPPVWCTGPTSETPHERCRLLAQPITGNDVATIVLALMQEANQ